MKRKHSTQDIEKRNRKMKKTRKSKQRKQFVRQIISRQKKRGRRKHTAARGTTKR
jgi:hypothetical protein